VTASLVGLLCRTSDRTPRAARGVEVLAPLVGKRLGREPRMIGSPGEPRTAGFAEDLADSRGCLLEAGGQVDDALTGGNVPVLLAGDCSIALTTLGTALEHRPEAMVLWLDAHGDFNTPDTTPSGFLGGMCLSAACGVWRPSATTRVDPARVHMVGVRDLDEDEREVVARAGVRMGVPHHGPVYVHLDCDVLDPAVHRSQFPVPGGMGLDGLRALLAGLGDRVVGIEVTALEDPALAPAIAELLR
jgi:arginase